MDYGEKDLESLGPSLQIPLNRLKQFVWQKDLMRTDFLTVKDNVVSQRGGFGVDMTLAIHHEEREAEISICGGLPFAESQAFNSKKTDGSKTGVPLVKKRKFIRVSSDENEDDTVIT
ncbi:hypothetical protein ElyMa_005847900 [Elysia marginata]|uniref:Uncharacterized protein n=1 Tax=Elysia marginata TaxID=1093978 RepID=A0AAV4G0D6_9GAST|nr:hypothetical protein ElyMa_005847900 [Elysia marginata]